MKRIICSFFLFVLLLSFKNGTAQQDSLCHIQVSILTCAPGDDLYSLFGHTALRIIDKTQGTDVIYNWGTFDFREPNFYGKFMKGNLQYFVSPENVQNFIDSYQYEERGVTEQLLDLTCEEKTEIKRLTDVNMQGDNRFYRYDFALDNCTTRVRDIIKNSAPKIHFTANTVPAGTTFRNMIHGYLDKGGQPWSKLGIDILLGAKLDKAVTNNEAMFLPEYLMKAFDSATTQQKPIVTKSRQLLPQKTGNGTASIYNPLIAIGAVCLLLFAISFLKAKWAVICTRLTDSLLLYITGLLGILLLIMWFATEHIMCSNNFNLLWALPTNFFAGFIAWKKPEKHKKYFSICFVITALLLIGWFWFPQQLNIALIPFVLLLLSRYFKLSGFYPKLYR